jgi:KUP system potassium uptake protein
VSNDVVPISIVRVFLPILPCISHPWQAFLLALFLAQPLGTSRLSFAFAPSTCLILFLDSRLTQSLAVTFVWLLLLATTGMFNITKFPGIFRAFDPSRAVMCKCGTLHLACRGINLFADFVRTKSYDTLSGVLLAITGCEALFAK